MNTKTRKHVGIGGREPKDLETRGALSTIIDTLLETERACSLLQDKLERDTISKKEASACLANQIATLKNLEKELFILRGRF